jgi:hypothetical protein
MLGKELKEIVDGGVNPVIEFNEYINDLEARFEEGMKAYITNVNIVYEDEIEIIAEERDFAEYNKNIEKPIWRKEWNGEYIYKYSETDDAIRWNGTFKFYEMLNEELCNFSVVDDSSLKLFRMYQENNNGISYVKWLENKVLTCNKF